MPGPEGGTAAALSTAVLFLLACAVAAADQSDADRAAAVYRRAQQLESAGDHAAALPLLWEAAGLAPRDSDIQNRLGEALERLGALDAALDAYRAALAVQPGFRKARNNLILALGKAGRSGEAVELARADAAASPRDADRQFTLGLALAEADVEAAVRTFRRVLALSPRHVLARYNLALVLKRADRLDAALDELQRVLEIEPRAEAHYTRGVIYWHQGDVERATAALRAALALQPAYVEAHHTLGTVLQARGDLDGASAALRRAVALRPDLRAHTSPWRVRSRRPERSTKRGGTERRPSACASGSAWSRKHAGLTEEVTVTAESPLLETSKRLSGHRHRQPAHRGAAAAGAQSILALDSRRRRETTTRRRSTCSRSTTARWPTGR